MSGRNTVSILFIVISLLVLIGLWFLLVPAIEKAQGSLAAKTAQKDEYAEKVTALNQAQTILTTKGSGGLPLPVDQLITALPPHRDHEDVLSMVESMAFSVGVSDAVSITLNATADEKKKDEGPAAVVKTPLNITFNASYDTVAQFISLLQEGLRPVSISTVNLRPVEGGGVNVSLVATTYTRAAKSTKTAASSTGEAAEVTDIENE